MFNDKSRFWLLGSLAAITLSANLAQAEARSAAAPQVSVVYSQTDLSSTHGVQTLYARLKSAARHVCPEVEIRNLAGAVSAKQCYQTALAQAVQKVRRPELTTLHVQSVRHVAG